MIWQYWIINNAEKPVVICNNEELRDKIFYLMHNILEIDCARVTKEK